MESETAKARALMGLARQSIADQSAQFAGTDGCLQVTVSVPASEREALADFVTQRLAESIELFDDVGGGLAAVRFYISDTAEMDYKTELCEFSGRVFPTGPPPVVETTRVDATDWVLRFRESVTAEIIDGTILVRPTWVVPDTRQRAGIETEIIIDPKMAFGTGSHETTRLCMCALKRFVRPGCRVADVGCGSGILSILAAKLGAGHVLALDIDSLAIENCRENCALNAVDNVVRIQRGSVELLDSNAAYDIVVANIILSGLLPLLDEMLGATQTGGNVILSGLLTNDIDTIEGALRNSAAKSWEIMRDGEWIGVITTVGNRSDR
ncbi:MAG: 50S ribosomal protein L11 methyltransferase [candidate division Zixibacteria bacterium]|nr:50S ribosomal protein L11 methyltransferase [candidate division Zixibacteria bacterium]